MGGNGGANRRTVKGEDGGKRGRNMQSCDQQRLERFRSPHAGAFANIGDVVVLDIPGHKPGQPMTVLEVYRTTGEILCVWHGRGGTPNRATFHAAELRVIQRAPKSVDGALNFDPQIARSE